MKMRNIALYLDDDGSVALNLGLSIDMGEEFEASDEVALGATAIAAIAAFREFGDGGSVSRDTKSASKGKGKGKGKAKEVEPEPEAEPEPEPEEPKRRRRAPPKAEEVSDDDLIAACSEYAEKWTDEEGSGVGIVEEILEEFGVKKSADLEGDQRQEFLDKLAEEDIAQSE